MVFSTIPPEVYIAQACEQDLLVHGDNHRGAGYTRTPEAARDQYALVLGAASHSVSCRSWWTGNVTISSTSPSTKWRSSSARTLAAILSSVTTIQPMSTPLLCAGSPKASCDFTARICPSRLCRGLSGLW